MVLCPTVMDIFEECWIVDLNLKAINQMSSQDEAFCLASPISGLWVTIVHGEAPTEIHRAQLRPFSGLAASTSPNTKN